MFAESVTEFVIELFWSKSQNFQKPFVPLESALKFGHTSGLFFPKISFFLVLLHSFILGFFKISDHKLLLNHFAYNLISKYILLIEILFMVPYFQKTKNKRMQ